ncbi:Mitochondrial inner membrane protease atp23 [Sorochytrium milnesiophthora]
MSTGDDAKIQEAERVRCEQWKADILSKNAKAVTLMQALATAGCAFDPAKHIRCVPCASNAGSGGFAPQVGIVLCQNRFVTKQHMEDTIVHELVHAFDHCMFKYDPSNCRHFACTEIRAANLSGDCAFAQEFARGNFALKKQHQACVKRRAVLAVSYNPQCRDVAEQVVDQVYASCFADTRPFNTIPE